MDSYDVHVHLIQFQLYQLYDKESFRTFNIIKNIFKYNTVLFILVEFTLPHVRNLISGCNHAEIIYQCSSGL
jgi:hypothetical protein